MSRAGPPSAALAAAAAMVFLALGALLGLAAGRSSGITVGAVAVQIELDRGEFRGGGDPIESWIRRSASIVAGYYGHFPVARLTVRVMAERGDGVHGGKSFANPQAYIQVRLGQDVTEAQLLSDWVLVHEMAHLALPDTGEAHAWLSEGLATYVEGVARVQAGNRSEADVWAEEMRQMPGDCPSRATAVSTAPIPGHAPTGAAPCSACWRTSTFTGSRTTASCCRMRCAPSCVTVAGRPRAGRSCVCSVPGIIPASRRHCGTYMRG